MYEKKTHRGRVLIVAAVAALLFGCAYGQGLNYSGADPLSGILLGTGGISQLPIIGPLADALIGGMLGYNNGNGYNDPYYGDRYGYDPYYGDPYGYDPNYGDRYRNDPNYGDRYYGDRYGNGSPNRYGPNYGYNGQPYYRYPYGYNDGY